MNISLPSDIIFSLGPIGITNGLLGGFIVSAVLIIGALIIAKGFDTIPGRAQMILELISDYIIEQLEEAFGDKKLARSFFPLFMTLLLLITIANQFMLVPFVFDITYGDAALFRQSTSDFAQPVALALMVFVISQVMAFKISPIKHLSNFFPLHEFKPVFTAKGFTAKLIALLNAFLQMGIGALNIIGEAGKHVALAARLFGNIFAGNVMVVVIVGLASFTQFLVPIPFIALSVFSGFIQAFVFMLLSVQFIAITMQGATPDLVEST
jgi:F-type H+-transporting ATPase subunit a